MGILLWKLKCLGNLWAYSSSFPYHKLPLKAASAADSSAMSTGDTYSWFHKLVDRTLSQRWIIQNMTNGYSPTIHSDGREITRALCMRRGNLWATQPALIIFNSRLKPLPRINNFLVFKCYKKHLCSVAIRQGVFLLLVGHCWCSSTLTEQTVSL